jgi:hypothetical protein
MSQYLLRSAFLALVVAFVLHGPPLSATYAAEEPDLIFKRSTVFKWVTPNDKLATYGLDDLMLRESHAISRFLSGVVV